ncbi:MAG TPA: hypothetical protein VGB83_07120 [Actinomycetota bacterium]
MAGTATAAMRADLIVVAALSLLCAGALLGGWWRADSGTSRARRLLVALLAGSLGAPAAILGLEAAGAGGPAFVAGSVLAGVLVAGAAFVRPVLALGTTAAVSAAAGLGWWILAADPVRVEGAFALVVAPALLASALALDLARSSRRAVVVPALALIASAMGAPALANLAMSPLVTVPAFGAFFVLARRTARWWHALVIALAAGGVTGMFLVAGAVDGEPVTGLTTRAGTWAVAWILLGILLVAAAIPARANHHAFARGTWGAPHLRAAGIAGAIAIVAEAVVLGDAMSAAWMAAWGVAAMDVVLLEGGLA